MTYSLPSRTAVVVSWVGSAPAPGSVIEKHDRISPASSGFIHRSFWKSFPPIASSSALPESGALLPKMGGANTDWPRISCMSPSLSWPKPPPPSSGSRCAAHSPWSFTCCLSPSVCAANASGLRSATSSGRISSRTKVRIHSSFASNSGSVEKFQLISGLLLETRAHRQHCPCAIAPPESQRSRFRAVI